MVTCPTRPSSHVLDPYITVQTNHDELQANQPTLKVDANPRASCHDSMDAIPCHQLDLISYHGATTREQHQKYAFGRHRLPPHLKNAHFHPKPFKCAVSYFWNASSPSGVTAYAVISTIGDKWTLKNAECTPTEVDIKFVLTNNGFAVPRDSSILCSIDIIDTECNDRCNFFRRSSDLGTTVIEFEAQIRMHCQNEVCSDAKTGIDEIYDQVSRLARQVSKCRRFYGCGLPHPRDCGGAPSWCTHSVLSEWTSSDQLERWEYSDMKNRGSWIEITLEDCCTHYTLFLFMLRFPNHFFF